MEIQGLTKRYLVTDIRQGLKNKNRVNVFIDHQYDFSLDLTQVVDFKLRVGKVVDERDLLEYRKASEFGKIYQQTLEWVFVRPRSIKETRDYLIRKRTKRIIENKRILENQKRSIEDRKKYHLKTKEIPLFSDEEIDMVINRLCERNYLNDEKFADYYAKNRCFAKGASRRKIQQEMRQKGIDNDLIEKALDESMRSDDEEIKKIIAKKKNRYTKEKLIAHLVRQGFSYQRSKDAVLEMD